MYIRLTFMAFVAHALIQSKLQKCYKGSKNKCHLDTITKRWVFRCCWEITSFKAYRRSSFHHQGTRNEKSINAGLPCTLRDVGFSGAVLKDQRECCVLQAVINFSVSHSF